jgi:hypothetical protein
MWEIPSSSEDINNLIFHMGLGQAVFFILCLKFSCETLLSFTSDFAICLIIFSYVSQDNVKQYLTFLN